MMNDDKAGTSLVYTLYINQTWRGWHHSISKGLHTRIQEQAHCAQFRPPILDFLLSLSCLVLSLPVRSKT
jgi:hypothetical protein